MSNKRRGLDKERELKKLLESEGFSCSRGRGSFGYFDIIAINKRIIKLIQVKRVKGKYYSFKKEIEEIRKFNNHPENVSKELWIWLDRIKGRKAGWEIIEIGGKNG